MKYDKQATILSLVTGVLVFPLLSCSSVSADGKEWVGEGDPEETASTTQALEGAHRLCSVVQPGNYRDTLVVPNGWFRNTCRLYAVQTSTSNYQLGCMGVPSVGTDNGVIWGPLVASSNTNPSPPSPNICNW
jgi:hypothetical protein